MWNIFVKSFLVFFVITASANATLQLSVTGGYPLASSIYYPHAIGLFIGQSVQIVIQSDSDTSYKAYLNVTGEGVGYVNEYAVLSAAGPVSSVQELNTGYQYKAVAEYASIYPKAGDHFAFDFVHDNAGDGIITLTDEQGNTLDMYAFYDIPEPATTLFFCIGAVFLRKTVKSR